MAATSKESLNRHLEIFGAIEKKSDSVGFIELGGSDWIYGQYCLRKTDEQPSIDQDDPRELNFA